MTVHAIVGTCDQAHRVGQEFVVGRWSPKGICMSALGSLYPAIRVLQYGGAYPWDEDPRITFIPCPDPKNRVVFRIERLEEEA